MRLTNFYGLRCKQLKLLIIALFSMFLLWKWEEGSYYAVPVVYPGKLSIFHSATQTRYTNHHPLVEQDIMRTNPATQLVKNIGKQTDGASSPLYLAAGSIGDVRMSGASDLSKKECNYANGRWVNDDRRPLYSGFGCKQYLAEGWACRLTRRPDFSYEKYRWQPEGCEMPDFDATSFLQRMQGQIIAYVGDSLGRQMFQSMMCMVTRGEERQDVEDVGLDYGFVMEPGAKRPNGWAYRFPATNTTILYYWSSTLCDLEPLNRDDPMTDYAMHLDRPPAFLKENLHRFNVLIVNTGHHWNRGKLKANRWLMYVGGSPSNDKSIAPIWKAKNFTVHSIVHWLDEQLPKYTGLRVFYRTLSPRHFFQGDWNTGGRCDNLDPLATGFSATKDRSDDADAEGAVKGTGIKLLDITALSQLRDEGHISRYSVKAAEGIQDCLHWCLPGVPDTWNEILAAQLTKELSQYSQ